MSRMGDVLAGFHAAWEFESDSVLIRYERGIRTPKLFQALGERRVPLEAIEGVTLTPGRRGTVVLRVEPRAGADPLIEAAAGQLKEGGDPYRLVLPADRETLAEYYADELRALLTESGRTERYLVAPPEAPLHFKAYDGKASFDGKAVSFRWSWTGASSAKWKAGDQSFPVADLGGVEWRSPEMFEGYLRLLPRDADASAAGAAAGPRRPSPRPTRIRRRSCSGWGTGRCTSRCRSRRRCWRRCGNGARAPRCRFPCRRLGGTRPTSPSGSGTWGSCISRAGDGRGVLLEEGGVAGGALTRLPGGVSFSTPARWWVARAHAAEPRIDTAPRP